MRILIITVLAVLTSNVNSATDYFWAASGAAGYCSGHYTTPHIQCGLEKCKADWDPTAYYNSQYDYCLGVTAAYGAVCTISYPRDGSGGCGVTWAANLIDCSNEPSDPPAPNSIWDAELCEWFTPIPVECTAGTKGNSGGYSPDPVGKIICHNECVWRKTDDRQVCSDTDQANSNSCVFSSEWEQTGASCGESTPPVTDPPPDPDNFPEEPNDGDQCGYVNDVYTCIASDGHCEENPELCLTGPPDCISHKGVEICVDSDPDDCYYAHDGTLVCVGSGGNDPAGNPGAPKGPNGGPADPDIEVETSDGTSVDIHSPGGSQADDPPENKDPNDLDGDGVPNHLDNDIDGDGIPNIDDDDSDGNGTPDDEENQGDAGTSPDATVGGEGDNTKKDQQGEGESDVALFCNDNPDSIICSKGKTTGSCGNWQGQGYQFTCDYDPVFCAIAENSFKQYCAGQHERSSVEAMLDGMKSRGEDIDSIDETALQSAIRETKNISDEIGNLALDGESWASGSCIGPTNIEALGQTFSFDMTLICDFAAELRNLILLFATVVAGYGAIRIGFGG